MRECELIDYIDRMDWFVGKMRVLAEGALQLVEDAWPDGVTDVRAKQAFNAITASVYDLQELSAKLQENYVTIEKRMHDDEA